MAGTRTRGPAGSHLASSGLGESAAGRESGARCGLGPGKTREPAPAAQAGRPLALGVGAHGT